MNFILIHGAFMSASCWRDVARRLTSAGHRVLTPTLRGEEASAEVNLGTHIEDVVHLIEEGRVEDSVLVGHSYAGMVITGVAEACPQRVRTLIYLDAALPEDGQSFLDVCHPGVAEQLRACVKDGWRVELPAGWSAASYGVEDPGQQAEIEAAITPQPLHIFDQPLRAPSNAAHKAKRVFIHCTDPRTAFLSQADADRARTEKLKVYSLECAHVSMVTHPTELTNLLIEAAAADE